MVKKFVIDCDPGVDDTMAILLAAAKLPAGSISLVTIVMGNHNDLALLARNARLALDLAGLHGTPVCCGRDAPLDSTYTGQSGIEVHGDDGVGNAHDSPALHAARAAAGRIAPGSVVTGDGNDRNDGLPFPGYSDGMRASDAMAALCRAYPGEVTIIALGPLSNLGEAVRAHPSFASDAAGVSMMGGALQVRGNKSPCAEANVHNDPEAAHTVLHAGFASLVMAPLNVTRQLCLETLLARLDERFAAAGSGNAVVAPVIHAIAAHYITKLKSWGQTEIPVHDSCAVMAAADPSVFTERQHIYVDVERAGEITRGTTVGDFSGHWRKEHPPQVHVLMKVDADRFYNVYVDAIAKLEEMHRQH